MSKTPNLFSLEPSGLFSRTTSEVTFPFEGASYVNPLQLPVDLSPSDRVNLQRALVNLQTNLSLSLSTQNGYYIHKAMDEVCKLVG